MFRSRKAQPLDLDWHRVIPMLAPDDQEVRTMLRELLADLGTAQDLAYALRVPLTTVRGWQDGRQGYSEPTKSLIHLAWMALLHPEKAGTAFDLMTWGRWRPIATRPAREPRDSFRNVAEDRLTDGAGI